MTRLLKRAAKLATIVRNPRFWPALALGVGASVEHASLPWSDDIATVIDVGANRGQFASLALAAFPGAMIYCFEPQAAASAKLRQVVTKSGGRDRVHVFETGLGAGAGQRPFYVASEDDSSSFLPMTSLQLREFGGEHVLSTTLPIQRIDAILRCVDLIPPVLMKIDVQGFELEVLKGSTALLDCVNDLLVECSFAELYAGQPQAAEIVSYLHSRHFNLLRLKPSASRADGSLLQADLLFRHM